MGSVKALDGHAYCLYFLNCSGFGVVLVLPDRPWKASLHACPTIDTFERVISYLTVSQTDFYSFGRTYSGTIAITDIYRDQMKFLPLYLGEDSLRSSIA